MCGIAGFNWDDKSLITKMTYSLSHRGPDDKGYFCDNTISFGHRRLSIIDLSRSGRQPMFTRDNNLCIVYNGEVYNFLEIRTELESKGYRFYSNTDTEVVLNAYKEFGRKCVEKFNGMFAFAIFDRKQNQIFLARDRLGIKPLYYYLKDGEFIFASEIKAILKAGIDKKINNDSLNKYLTFRYNPSHETLFQDIKKIPPSHTAVFDLKQKTLSLQKYWEIDITKKSPSSAAKLVEIYKESVSKRLISDVPLGVYLSGGLDSASIVGMMHSLGKDVKTFSINFGDDERNQDAGFARKVAEHFNTSHKEVFVEPSLIKLLPEMTYFTDEPLADPSTIPTYLLSKEVKKHVTVALNGGGGDEVFGGYSHYKFLRLRNYFKWTPKFIAQAAPKLMLNKNLRKISPYLTSFGQEGAKRFGEFISASKDKTEAYLKITSIFDEKERAKLLDKPADSINLKQVINSSPIIG